MKKRFLIWDSPKQAIIMLVVVLLIIGSINVFSATYIDCTDPLEYFKKYWLNVVVSTFLVLWPTPWATKESSTMAGYVNCHC